MYIIMYIDLHTGRCVSDSHSCSFGGGCLRKLSLKTPSETGLVHSHMHSNQFEMVEIGKRALSGNAKLYGLGLGKYGL